MISLSQSTAGRKAPLVVTTSPNHIYRNIIINPMVVNLFEPTSLCNYQSDLKNSSYYWLFLNSNICSEPEKKKRC